MSSTVATPSEIKETAEAFFAAYRSLDVQTGVVQPKVVCLALSVELVLKALLVDEGTRYGRLHSLYSLFVKLSTTTRAEVMAMVEAPAPEFLRKLAEAQTSDAFVRWRYIHEVPLVGAENTWTGCLNQLYTAASAVLYRHLRERRQSP